MIYKNMSGIFSFFLMCTILYVIGEEFVNNVNDL